MEYKALRIIENSDGSFERKIETLDTSTLPAGELLIRVHYSSLNYKDALSATGNKGITKNYPHTPGIDAAGEVISSSSPLFSEGQSVLITGYDLGMNCAGGYGQFIRIPAAWALKKPASLSMKDCMTIGTAGVTAAIGLYKMELLGLKPTDGPIVVTGATGGVGSMALCLLHQAGYETIAITGKPDAYDYLKSIGANHIEGRNWVDDASGKPLIKPRWAGAIDTVGGNTLATLLKGCMNEGKVVSTGLVGSAQLQTTVFPFILNGISLLGVGSAETPLAVKKEIWSKLSGPWNIQEHLEKIRLESDLEAVSQTYIPAILEGKIRGRVVVSLD